MLIVTQSYNKVTSIETFSSEREAVEHFLQIVSEEEGEKITFSDNVFIFQETGGREFQRCITYEGSGEDTLAVQLFGVEDINQYVRYWVLRVYLKSGGCKYFNIKDRNEKEANNEADNIIKEIDPQRVSDWTLTPKRTY